ncbi:hypothetical protein [Bacillus cereus group sp. BfR-BA-01380]|uniref:hypothetical protein n=1 Tax=Bacillus cereus group sp. BfR-BA-01380 TaxID=2920324 RepID=UPI001F5AC43E|nr:hypothetical protein [Bacillus cereus group sp. BfR-BA-01380]
MIALKAKSFVQKLGDALHKGKTVVKTIFLEADKKVQAAIKTLMEYKWIPGTGKEYAIPGGGSVRDAGSLKDVYQFMKDTGEKVKNWVGGEGATQAEEIVGTKHNAIKPTQDMVNREKVDYYIEKLKAGEKIEPIEVVDIEGKGKFIIEGHHRYVASKETGILIEIKIKKDNRPTGMPDWSYVDWKKYINEEQFWGD